MLLLNTVLFEFVVDFRVPWVRFGNLLGIFSGMGAKVKTVLAPTRELDFQGLGGRYGSFLKALRERRFERPLLRGFVPI